MKFRITRRVDENGNELYIAKKRVWFFFWSEKFKVPFGYVTCKSNNIQSVVDFIVDYRKVQQWNNGLNLL